LLLYDYILIIESVQLDLYQLNELNIDVTALIRVKIDYAKYMGSTKFRGLT